MLRNEKQKGDTRNSKWQKKRSTGRQNTERNKENGEYIPLQHKDYISAGHLGANVPSERQTHLYRA